MRSQDIMGEKKMAGRCCKLSGLDNIHLCVFWKIAGKTHGEMVVAFENMGWRVKWAKTNIVPIFVKKDGVIK